MKEFLKSKELKVSLYMALGIILYKIVMSLISK